MKLSKPILATAFLIQTFAASAHSPILHDDEASYTINSPFEIDDPEHSKAVYSELKGSPEYYKIVSSEPFRFYVGITQAKLENCDMQRSFSFDVLDNSMSKIDGRNGEDFEWWPWYEEFGRMWYWVGPEIGEDFKGTKIYQPGIYWIKVHNADNFGKYVLAIGDIERFGLGSIISLLTNRTLNKLRDGWWDSELCNS